MNVENCKIIYFKVILYVFFNSFVKVVLDSLLVFVDIGVREIVYIEKN